MGRNWSCFLTLKLTSRSFFEVVSLRSIVRGFVLLGSEIGDLSGKLKEAEVHLEHQMLKLASTEQQVQKISRQYRELKEQLQSTSSFSQITSLRDSLPSISYSGASAQENSRAEQPRLQELVKQLQNDLITARRDEADARRNSAVADARAEELDGNLTEMLSFAKAQRAAMDEVRAREEALEEQLRHNSELMTAADAEQNLQVPRLKELLRTAVEREAVLTEQVREMQLAQALTTPAMEQEDCAVVYKEQISSLETQLQEMQQELQQVQQKNQVEVFELKEQLASRAEQVGSATAAEIQDAARKPTARSSLLQPNGAVMKKSETLAQFLAGSRNVSMAQPEQDKFGEVIQELINWEQGEDEQKGLFSVPPQIKASERPGIFSSLRAQAAKEFKHRSELYSIQHVMARIAEILPTYGRERSILQAALCEADVREAQKLYRKLYEETGGSSDDVDRAQAEDGELLLLITDAMLSKLDDGFKAELVGTTSFDRITITKLPPYTLHPTPYTLHPTPYTLHPTPYTLHPPPYTLHPTPYTLHPTPHTLHPAEGRGRAELEGELT